MSKQRRQLSPEVKYSILQEGGGRPHRDLPQVQPGLFSTYLLEEKIPRRGREGLKASYRKIDPVVRKLEQELETLKRIIAKQTIALEFKRDLLKKSDFHFQKRRQ